MWRVRPHSRSHERAEVPKVRSRDLRKTVIASAVLAGVWLTLGVLGIVAAVMLGDGHSYSYEWGRVPGSIGRDGVCIPLDAIAFTWTSVSVGFTVTPVSPVEKFRSFLGISYCHWCSYIAKTGVLHGMAGFAVEWPVLVLVFLTPSVATLIWRRCHRCKQDGVCRKCRYDLTGNVSGTCPECGTHIGETRPKE
jgi:hypothetical protein